jgi:hypothetical protein
MQQNQSYQVKPTVVCTELEDGAVLLDVETKYYYHINESSLHIWNGCQQNMHVGQIVDSLLASFEVDEQNAFDSVLHFTHRLEEEGLVTSV